MYGFDKLFGKYIQSKGHIHEDEFASAYDTWYNLFDNELNDSPKNVIEKMSDEQLISELREECSLGSPSYAVMDALERRSPEKLLTALLYDENKDVVYCAAELLSNADKTTVEAFVNLLARTDDDELFELIVTELKYKANAAKNFLFDIEKDADLRLKSAIAEILVCSDKDERTFSLLKELFASGENLPLCCGLFAAYGDERAAAMLYRALDTASYADYIEIRNAIESLGGVVDDQLRDFTDDEEYKAIKGGAKCSEKQ